MTIINLKRKDCIEIIESLRSIGVTFINEDSTIGDLEYLDLNDLIEAIEEVDIELNDYEKIGNNY